MIDAVLEWIGPAYCPGMLDTDHDFGGIEVVDSVSRASIPDLGQGTLWQGLK